MYEILGGLPYYSDYMPDAVNQKAVLFYSLWSRPTLQYSANCSKDINDALDILENLQDSQDNSGLNTGTWITAICCAGVVLIYNSITTCCCLMKTNRRITLCFRINNIMAASVYLTFSVALLVMVCINFGILIPKYG